MTPRELPEYLRPVPGPGEGSAAAAQATQPQERQEGHSGLIPPSHRGHSRGFVTDAIVDLGYATRDQVEQAIATARTAGRTPEAILLEQGVIDGERLSRATAERYGLDYVDLTLFNVDMAAANLISVKSARRHQAVPISFIDEGTLLLAMADPSNVLALDDVQMATDLNCRVAVAPVDDIDALIGKLSTLERTVTEGASDIHFEPHGGEMRIRFRVDGVLEEIAKVPKRMVNGVISRIKIMSDLDIAEKRIPQDGRVAVNIEERRIDLRVT